MGSGWVALPGYSQPQLLPEGVKALSNYVSVPEVLVRRMAQVGLVEAADGPRLQKALLPGQRLVSLEGDLWRWDGFRAAAEDAPSAAALRLQQLNRLEELKKDLNDALAKAEGMAQAHDMLTARLAELAEADKTARIARRAADTAVADANRALSRAEADRNLAESKLDSSGLAVSRHEEEAMAARKALAEAEATAKGLANLDDARAAVEDVKMTVEAARMTMMAKRSGYDEVRREGEARTKRRQEIIKEVSGWKHRLETANKRTAELLERKSSSEEELEEAMSAPEDIAIKREELAEAIEDAEERRRTAADALAEGETALRETTVAERDAERTASEAREARAPVRSARRCCQRHHAVGGRAHNGSA